MNLPNGNSEVWKFQIPRGYDLSRLAADLSSWIEETGGTKSRLREIPGGFQVEAWHSGSAIKRLVRRKASGYKIALVREDGALFVSFPDRDEASETAAEKEISQGIFSAASRAVNRAAGVAGEVAEGIGDIWTENHTLSQALEMIGRHIERAFPAKEGRLDHPSPFIEPLSMMETNWIDSILQPGEILLAWLKTSTREEGLSEEWAFALTSEKIYIAALSARGLEAGKEIPPSPMHVTNSFGRDTATIDAVTFRTELSNDHLFRRIAEITDLDPEGRITGAARLVLQEGDPKSRQGKHALTLMDRLCRRRNDPLHQLARFYVQAVIQQKKGSNGAFDGAVLPPDFPEITAPLPNRLTATELLQWAKSWNMNTWDRLMIGGWIGNAHPESVYHARLTEKLIFEARERMRKESKKAIEFHTIADIAYAENLTRQGRRKEADEILEERLSALPDESAGDLLPGGDARLTEGKGGQMVRAKILELLIDLRGEPEIPDPATLAELAMLQPLVSERLEALSRYGQGEIRKRAQAAFHLLAEPGMGEPHEISARDAVSLSSKEVEEGLRHPAAREGTTFNRIQGFLAEKHPPDHSALKSFAKRVTPNEHPELFKAIADGAKMLDLGDAGDAEGYITYGDLDVGVRGHEGKPPFILIGGQHTQTDSPFLLDAAEARFLIGAELGHIRFGHERITSREVWEGVFSKTLSVMGVIPVFGTYMEKLGRLGKFAKAAGAAKRIGGIHRYLSQARDVAFTATDYYGRYVGTELGTDEKEGRQIDEKDAEKEELMGAFRVMQLTADRVGLVLCADIDAAVRAMFKSNRSRIRALPAARSQGLKNFLSETEADGSLRHFELALRIASLFSFYLSEEFERLRLRAFPE